MAKDPEIDEIKNDVEEIKGNVSSISSDTNKIKDSTDSISEDVKDIDEKGVRVKSINGNSFNQLKSIKAMEESLSNTDENTHHIHELISSNGELYNLIAQIRDEVVGVNSSLGSNEPQGNETQNSGVTLQNSSLRGQSFGGFSDTINKIYNEIKAFRQQVVASLEIEKSISNEDTTDSIVQKLKKLEEAKEQVKREKELEQQKPENIRAERKRRKEQEKYRRKVNKQPLGTLSGHTLGTMSAFTSIAKGAKTDDIVNGLSSTLSKLGPWGAVAGGAIQGIKALFDLYAKQDKEASEYARTIGGSQFGKNQIIQVANRTAAAAPARYGLNQEDVIKQARETAEALGRSISDLSTKSLLASSMLKKMGVGADAVGNFDTYGKSIQQTDQYFTDLYKQVSRRGLSFKNVSKAVNDNLKNAQSYNFARGLKGLEAMAERSTQLKFNMQQALTFADKVSTFEDAIKASANLSVLGGTFGAYSNPMQMMYEGLNDVEALQERMIKMFGDKAYYDKDMQQMRINPVDLQFIKTAAEAIGADKNEMVSLAMNQGRYKMVESQIDKTKFDKETIEYIKNLSEIGANGQANITLNGTTKAISSLTSADAAQIKNESKAKEDKNAATMGDIFVHTKSISETLDDLLKYLQTKLGMWVAKIAGVKFDGAASRGVWRNLEEYGIDKDELIAKYGGRHQAKLAVGMGEETENVNKILGRNKYEGEGDLVREFLNQKAEKTKGRRNKVANELNDNWRKGNLDDEFERWKQERFTEQKASGIVQGNYHVNGGVPAIYDGKPVEIEKDETLFGKDVLYRYGSDFLKNIKDHNVPTITSVKGVYVSPIGGSNTVYNAQRTFNSNTSFIQNQRLTRGGNTPNVVNVEGIGNPAIMPVIPQSLSIQNPSSPMATAPLFASEPILKNSENTTITNINGNTLNPLSVAPTAQVSSGQPEKISFDTFKVEVGGKIDLTTNGGTKSLDISKLSQTDLDKLTSMIYKQVYNEISRRINRGFDKESNPFRGA